MAGYKEIKGFQVQTRSEDPTPYAQALADNPYGGTWSSGGAMNTARRDLSAAGIQTAALGIGGYISDYSALNENYNGGDFKIIDKFLNFKRGDILIFPSNFMFPHEVKKVTKGERWSIVSWLM